MTHIELYHEEKLRSDLVTPNVEHDITHIGERDENDVLRISIEIDGTRYGGSEAYEATGDFHWRMVHTNGNVVAASTEGYADRRDMIWNLQYVLGGRFDHAGTVLKRRTSIGAVGRWQRFDVHDLTKSSNDEGKK